MQMMKKKTAYILMKVHSCKKGFTKGNGIIKYNIGKSSRDLNRSIEFIKYNQQEQFYTQMETERGDKVYMYRVASHGWFSVIN